MSERTLAILGKSGLVGSRSTELLREKGKIVVLTPDSSQIDITDREAVRKWIEIEKPDVIVNFAAYTDVGEAESQRGNKKGQCWQTNVEGVRNLVETIDPEKTHLIHISTDMVFPGAEDDPGPYTEDHEAESDPNKLTWYGFTKAEAERVLLKRLGDRATIVRIMYPVRAKFDKLDYLRKPLSLYDEGGLYPMFTDQQVSITFIDDLTRALKAIIKGKQTGIFHVSSRDTASPHELVSYLLEKARGVEGAVRKGNLGEFLRKVDNPVRYPMYGGFKVEKTEERLGIRFKTWREIIDTLVEQGIGTDISLAT